MLPIFGFIGPIELVVILCSLAMSAFWVWMLVDCALNQRLQGTEKIVWVLLILFLHFLGALLYFLIARGKQR